MKILNVCEFYAAATLLQSPDPHAVTAPCVPSCVPAPQYYESHSIAVRVRGFCGSRSARVCVGSAASWRRGCDFSLFRVFNSQLLGKHRNQANLVHTVTWCMVRQLGRRELGRDHLGDVLEAGIVLGRHVGRGS